MIKVECRLSPKISSPSSPLSLWYDKAAVQWLEALPIGNGHMGGMIYGGFPSEIIQINEYTVWTGGPHDYSNEGAFKALPNIRQLIEQNQWTEAQSMLDANFFGKPVTQAAYQPVGNVKLDFVGQSLSSISQYQRQLDLEQAIATTVYTDESGVQYRRDCFASYPDRCIIVQLESLVSLCIISLYLIDCYFYLVFEIDQLCCFCLQSSTIIDFHSFFESINSRWYQWRS
jgi:alpha-L-fucosidase 2